MNVNVIFYLLSISLLTITVIYDRCMMFTSWKSTGIDFSCFLLSKVPYNEPSVQAYDLVHSSENKERQFLTNATHI